MGKGQSNSQDYAGPFSKENAAKAGRQPVSSRAFGAGQGWHGPYTSNKIPGYTRLPGHDDADNPVAGVRRRGDIDGVDANDGYAGKAKRR